MKRWTALMGLFAGGCATASSLPQAEEGPAVIGWRLVERSVASIEDRWATAGDGVMPGDAKLLVYEALYARGDKDPSPEPIPSPAPCGHLLRMSAPDDLKQGVGNRVELAFSVDGPLDAAHVVEVRPTRPGVVLLEMRGASRLQGEPARFLLPGGGRAVAVFTSEFAGRGGLEITVTEELSLPSDSAESFAPKR